MATESLPESASISFENWVQSLGTIYSQSSQEDLYPASNLTLFDRTARWWTVNATDNGIAWVDLGTAKLPTLLALIDSNLDSGETVTLKGADDSNITTNVLTWTFTTWEQSDIGKTLRWYMGDPDSGSAAARRYWQLILPANGTSDSQHQLGGWWLGEHEDFQLAPGWDFRSVNPPRRVNRYLVHREVNLETTSRLVWTDFYPLLEKFEKIADSQQKHCFLDLHGNTTDDAIKKISGHYGIVEGGSVRGVSQHADNSDLAWTFQETHEEHLGGA